MAYTYWQHIWTGTCHRAELGHEWNISLWGQITKVEYDDWVMMRQAMWTWTPEQVQELKMIDQIINEDKEYEESKRDTYPINKEESYGPLFRD